jgi:hypothetical protein
MGRLPDLRHEALEVRRQQRARWQAQIARLRALVEAATGARPPRGAPGAVEPTPDERSRTEVLT